jgi:6-phosphogluconate dehydrogenase (decarboxylating)
MNYAEMFYLEDSGEGRWTVRHSVTDEFAGTIMRTSAGLVLRDGESRFRGTFPSVESVLRNLYALA